MWQHHIRPVTPGMTIIVAWIQWVTRLTTPDVRPCSNFLSPPLALGSTHRPNSEPTPAIRAIMEPTIAAIYAIDAQLGQQVEEMQLLHGPEC